MYRSLGPADGTGIYGAPDQYIVMGDAAAIVLAPAPVVDLARYLGTWYEVGSVKQFFSIGLVNTTAGYSPNPDGSIKVENSGNYFVNSGPKSTIVGSALPVDTDTNNKLNVKFFGAPAATPPGNYWIVDLDPDYQWAVVTDSTGGSGFLLTRDRVVSADFYRELLARASVDRCEGTDHPHPAARGEPGDVGLNYLRGIEIAETGLISENTCSLKPESEKLCALRHARPRRRRSGGSHGAQQPDSRRPRRHRGPGVRLDRAGRQTRRDRPDAIAGAVYDALAAAGHRLPPALSSAAAAGLAFDDDPGSGRTTAGRGGNSRTQRDLR